MKLQVDLACLYAYNVWGLAYKEEVQKFISFIFKFWPVLNIDIKY